MTEFENLIVKKIQELLKKYKSKMNDKSDQERFRYSEIVEDLKELLTDLLHS
jgi:hypothetical protein